MNKKLLKSFAAAAMSVLAIACAKEQVGPGEGAMVEATFSVDVPGVIGTKAVGDGLTASKLYYQVFDAEGKAIDGLGVQSADLTGRKATVSFQLIKDQTYNFIFWAQTPEAGYYTIDATEGLKKISADYTTHKEANDEKRDAFFAVEKDLKITGPLTKTIELKRPFAQVNIGTVGSYKVGDKEKAIDFSEAKSLVKIVYIPTEFSPLAEEQVSKTKTTTFAAAEIPEGNITVEGKSYKYMAMNYIFASEEGSVYDVTATLKVGGKNYTVTVPNTPLKRNWRTNIVGDFLTGSAEFNVVVNPGFETETSDMDLNNPKNETELAAALATFGQATVSSDIEFSTSMSSKSKSTLTIASGASLAPAAGFSPSVSELIFVGGGELTLDGEGTVVGPSNSTYGNGSQAILVQGGTVNIKGNLKVEGGSGSVGNHAVTITDGTANIYGGYFHAGLDKDGKSSDLIYLRPAYRKYAKCNIYGGIFEMEGDAGFLVNMKDSERAKCAIAIYGGTFVGFNPADNKAEGEHTNFVAEGYRAVEITYEGKQAWKVEEIPAVTTHEDFNSAITSASAGVSATIKLASNMTAVLDNGIANEGDKSRNITFVGDGTQTFDVITKATNAEGGMLNYQRGSSFTFKNMSIKAGEGSFDGVVCDELVYENCTITGKLTLYGKATFVNCVFENTMANQYSIWTWGGTDVKFDKCTFNTNGKAILLYGKATEAKPTNLIVTNCTLNDRKNGAAGKAAIEIGNDYNATYNLTISDCVINGFAEGKNTGSKTWANKNSMDAAHLSVTIDRVKIQ